MTKPLHSPAVILALALAPALLGGCPSSEENAATLWLDRDGRETEVRLIDHEPPPY